MLAPNVSQEATGAAARFPVDGSILGLMICFRLSIAPAPQLEAVMPIFVCFNNRGLHRNSFNCLSFKNYSISMVI
jgi:hypothetical protein